MTDGPDRIANVAMLQTEIPRDLPTFEDFIIGCMRREPTDIIVGECRDGSTMTEIRRPRSPARHPGRLSGAACGWVAPRGPCISYMLI
jgi:hypothetical protein